MREGSNKGVLQKENSHRNGRGGLVKVFSLRGGDFLRKDRRGRLSPFSSSIAPFGCRIRIYMGKVAWASRSKVARLQFGE